MNYQTLGSSAVLLIAVFLSSCGAVSYVKSEVTGTAKPEGGIAEVIPPTRTFRAPPAAVKRAVLTVLQEQGYIFEDNPATGSIRTELRPLTPSSGIQFASYSVRLFLKVDGQSVTHQARFDKKSGLVQGETNAEFPEKENELRKAFFAALDSKLPK